MVPLLYVREEIVVLWLSMHFHILSVLTVYLAILLGPKGGQWKRISSDHTFLHRPEGTTLQTRFIS
ncbi:hypothetical protein GALMADRAFT_1083920 [Galerina marginata CBS 339.88]|uniref:Uncharacterized protein n=1 Tax=Galerina marginata (strain CBS 339.88) TaxID=685588 RepID=A0A067SI03_GALM3|nr:hypothetical protein GALMADRAFT_1083920 [Galerina marginata CBS 339.88]